MGDALEQLMIAAGLFDIDGELVYKIALEYLNEEGTRVYNLSQPDTARMMASVHNQGPPVEIHQIYPNSHTLVIFRFNIDLIVELLLYYGFSHHDQDAEEEDVENYIYMTKPVNQPNAVFPTMVDYPLMLSMSV